MSDWEGDAMPKLTKPQEALLERVNREGKVVLNGRARRTVEALERAGRVTSTYWLIPQVKGNGIEFVERFAVVPALTRWIDYQCGACEAMYRTAIVPPGNEPTGGYYGPCPNCGAKERVPA
jgi:hypothetical protein